MTTQNTLDQSFQAYQSLLSDFLINNNVAENLATSFGDNFDTEGGIASLESLANGNVTIPFSIVHSSSINQAHGAYSASNNTIYLSTELIESGDVDAITRTLLEETGHYLDSQINSSDASGDEGAIFASIVLGEELNTNQLALLQAEDDTAIVTIDGETRTIEKQGIIYVHTNASGENNGSSWANAYTNLQVALENVVAGDEIWVADGTYRPTTGTDREASFVIPNDVQVYGGFSGGETELSQRDIEQNLTILSGDISTPDNNTDNVYHVVTITDATSDTILNGFTITGGNADLNSSGNSGGGIYASNSSAILRNLIIRDNSALYGAGMYSDESQHQLINVQFVSNSALSLGDGGGLYTFDSIDSLDNVTFKFNFANRSGGAILNDGSTLDLNDVEFIANQANDYGGGVYNSIASIFNLSNGVFLNNRALDNGGGIFNNSGYSDSEFNVSNTIFKGNVADLGAGIYNSQTNEATNTVINSLFEDNYSRFGGGIYNYYANPKIINSTFVNNLSQFGSGIGSEGREDDQSSIINSIFWDNLSIFGASPINDSDSVTSVSDSLVEGGFPGTGIINEDPQFVDPNRFDYRLSAGSPALNVGTNDAVSTDQTDLSGNPRIADGTVDLGAYEGAALEPVPTRLQASDTSTIIYVNQNASGNNDGTSWANAHTSLKEALENAEFGSQIWVADGTYTPSLDDRTVSFQLNNGVALYGGFTGGETSLLQRNVLANPTILSGEIGQSSDINDNSHHVVNASNVTNSAILDGFTIRGGNANDSSSDVTAGGGIYSDNSQATFRNLVIEKNTAIFGGGVYTNENSSHRFENVIFAGNNATGEGGAVYNEGNSFFFDSQFLNNTAEEEGGAILNDKSGIYIENTTFDSNRASIAGGAIYFDDFSTGGTYEKIVNSVFNNNDSPTGGAIYNYYSDAQGVNLTFANNEAENGAAVYSIGRDDDVNPVYYNSIF